MLRPAPGSGQKVRHVAIQHFQNDAEEFPQVSEIREQIAFDDSGVIRGTACLAEIVVADARWSPRKANSSRTVYSLPPAAAARPRQLRFFRFLLTIPLWPYREGAAATVNASRVAEKESRRRFDGIS